MGSRKTHEGAEKVYEAAELWVGRALRSDDSLFTPGKAIWKRELLGELRERFLDQPDEGSDSFLKKVERQLTDSPPEIYQLMGEVLYVHFLIIAADRMKGITKKNRIEKVLGWSSQPVRIPQKLVDALEPGIGGTGRGYQSDRPYQLGFLIEFMESWKGLELGQREELLRDPWRLKELASEIDYQSELMQSSGAIIGTMQRECLLHMVFPDTFERVFSFSQKERISEAFADLVAETTDDVDRKLFQIRQALEKKRKRDFDFYDFDIRANWDATLNPWDSFVKLAKAYLATGKLEEQELDYKIEFGQRMMKAREALLVGTEDWPAIVYRALSASNLSRWQDNDDIRKWCAEHGNEAFEAMQSLWAGDGSPLRDRIRAFNASLRLTSASGPGSRMRPISVLLMGLDFKNHPPFMVSVFNEAYRLTGYGEPPGDADEATLYEHALASLIDLSPRPRSETWRSRIAL